MVFALIAAGNNILQDTLSQEILRRAAARNDPPCRYRRIIPGWLLKPPRMKRAIRSVMCCVWIMSVITQLGHVWKQQDFLLTNQQGGSG